MPGRVGRMGVSDFECSLLLEDGLSSIRLEKASQTRSGEDGAVLERTLMLVMT